MLTIALAVASLLSAQAAPTPVLPEPSPRAATSSVYAEVHASTDHLDSARKALKAGEFDVARREFVIAAALDRDEGRLPVDAMFGLASVLYARSFNREAAMTMDRLAEEASTAGDSDTEARALLNAIWLNIDCGQRARARMDGLRLSQLLKEGALSGTTLKLVKERFR